MEQGSSSAAIALVPAVRALKWWAMAFSDTEIARYAALNEKLIWAKHRPPLHLRDQVRVRFA